MAFGFSPMATLPGFDDLWTAWTWRPIRGCPGRFTLVDADQRRPVASITGQMVDITAHDVPGVRDRVLVTQFPDGAGLISYARVDGTLLHTLNTPAGFVRKLGQLGITPLACP